MRKLFSWSFYIDTLYRLRVITIFAITYFTFMSSSVPSTFIIRLMDRQGPVAAASAEFLKPYEFMSILGFALLFVPIMTMVAFSFLYKRNTADFFEHLPYTRLSMSISALLAVLSSAICVITASALFSSLLLIPSVSAGIVNYDFLDGLLFVLAILILSIYTMAATFVGVSVTGTFIGTSMTVLSIVLLPRALMSLTTALLERLAPTLIVARALPILNNSYNLATTLSVDKFSVLGTPTAYIYTFVLSAVLLVLGIYLYRLRRSESATRTFASRTALDVLRSAVTATLTLFAISILYTALGAASLFFVLVAFAIHYALGRFIGRGKGMKRTLITFAIGVGGACLIFVSTLIGSAVSNSYSPDADEISFVTIARELDDGQLYINYSDYVELRVSDIKISDSATRALVATALEREMPRNYFDYRTVAVGIKSGFATRYRYLYLTKEEANALNSSCAQHSDYKEKWLDVGEGAYDPYIYVGGEQVEKEKVSEIFEKYKAEVNSLGYEEFISLYFGEWSDYTLCYSINHNGSEHIVNLPIFEQLSETYALAQKYAREIEEKRYNDIISRLDEVALSDEVQYLSIEYYGATDYYSAYIELHPESMDREDIVKTVKSYIKPLVSYNKSGTLFVMIYSDELGDPGISGSFAINDEISEDEIISFIKSHEYREY